LTLNATQYEYMYHDSLKNIAVILYTGYMDISVRNVFVLLSVCCGVHRVRRHSFSCLK